MKLKLLELNSKQFICNSNIGSMSWLLITWKPIFNYSIMNFILRGMLYLLINLVIFSYVYITLFLYNILKLQ